MQSQKKLHLTEVNPHIGSPGLEFGDRQIEQRAGDLCHGDQAPVPLLSKRFQGRLPHRRMGITYQGDGRAAELATGNAVGHPHLRPGTDATLEKHRWFVGGRIDQRR